MHVTIKIKQAVAAVIVAIHVNVKVPLARKAYTHTHRLHQRATPTFKVFGPKDMRGGGKNHVIVHHDRTRSVNQQSTSSISKVVQRCVQGGKKVVVALTFSQSMEIK